MNTTSRSSSTVVQHVAPRSRARRPSNGWATWEKGCEDRYASKIEHARRQAEPTVVRYGEAQLFQRAQDAARASRRNVQFARDLAELPVGIVGTEQLQNGQGLSSDGIKSSSELRCARAFRFSVSEFSFTMYREFRCFRRSGDVSTAFHVWAPGIKRLAICDPHRTTMGVENDHTVVGKQPAEAPPHRCTMVTRYGFANLD